MQRVVGVRVHRICTPNKIKTELKLIRKFLSWNGFPKRIANLLIDRFTTNAQNRAPDHITNDTPQQPAFNYLAYHPIHQ